MLLSQEARSLWAKTNPAQQLEEHLRCAAETADIIWREWLPHGARALLADKLGEESARRLYVALAALHDVGKATPAFQLAPHIPAPLRDAVLAAGLLPARTAAAVRHSVVSQKILEERGVARCVAVVVGGHHGRSPSREAINESLDPGASAYGFRSDPWRSVQEELCDYALELAGMRQAELNAIELTIPQQMLLTGWVVLADWIASAGGIALPERWTPSADWTQYGAETFRARFPFSPNAMQLTAIETALATERPGIAVIEAAMGSGKTESALAMAEIFAEKMGRSGVYFALPTRATADGIFMRFRNWICSVGGGEPHALELAHGKAKFHDLYRELPRLDVLDEAEGPGGVYVHRWLSGRKKQLLADFAVGTVDQLLMAALRHKYAMLRHVGLANKVVIVDEVHAYDAYMDAYLYRALHWLGEYGVPVILLSATLPGATRRKLVDAYLGKAPEKEPPPVESDAADYPLITYTDGDAIRQVRPPQEDGQACRISIERFDGEMGDQLEALLQHGGCAGVLLNTVRRAQEVAEALARRFGEGEVVLLHARFTAVDRAVREASLLESLGKAGSRPHRLIVVGTQVLEQSLDIDFDVLFTQVCPMDLLLQRIGRLHRHRRHRPPGLTSPQCYVMGTDAPDAGSASVYGEYPLLCTRYLLPKSVCLPDDIAPLVQAAYGDAIPVPEAEQAAFERAKEEQNAKIKQKEARATTFRLGDPVRGSKTLVGWFDYTADDPEDRQGEASVRDGSGALEVILLCRTAEGFRLLPWVSGGAVVLHDRPPAPEIAYALAGCSVPLPFSFTGKDWSLGKTIRALEEIRQTVIPNSWDESHWLCGALYLPLDENLIATLRGYTVRYDRTMGLMVKREGEEWF